MLPAPGLAREGTAFGTPVYKPHQVPWLSITCDGSQVPKGRRDFLFVLHLQELCLPSTCCQNPTFSPVALDSLLLPGFKEKAKGLLLGIFSAEPYELEANGISLKAPV